MLSDKTCDHLVGVTDDETILGKLGKLLFNRCRWASISVVKPIVVKPIVLQPPRGIRRVLGQQMGSDSTMRLGAVVMAEHFDQTPGLGRGRQASFGSCRIEHVELAPDLGSGGVGHGHEGITKASRSFDRPVSAGANPYRHATDLGWRWSHRCPRQRIPLGLMGHVTFGPQPANDLDAIDETRKTVFHLHTKCVEFFLAIALTKRENETPTTELVDQRNLLGDINRRVQRQQHQVRPQIHVPAVGSQMRQQRQLGEEVEAVGQMMFAGPDRIETQPLGRLDLLHDRPQVLTRILVLGMLRVQVDTHFQRHDAPFTCLFCADVNPRAPTSTCESYAPTKSYLPRGSNFCS